MDRKTLLLMALWTIALPSCIPGGGIHVYPRRGYAVAPVAGPQAGWPPGKCHLNSNGSQTCGYNCRLGSNGFYYCSTHPQGRCALQSDGTWACP